MKAEVKNQTNQSYKERNHEEGGEASTAEAKREHRGRNNRHRRNNNRHREERPSTESKKE